MPDSFFVRDNPLLEDFRFPAYRLVEPEHVRQIPELLKHLEDKLVALEATVKSKKAEPLERVWLTLVEPFEKISYRLSVVWGIVEHLKTVHETPELRSVFEELQPEVIEFQMRLKQSQPIYDAFTSLRDSSDSTGLDEARKCLVMSRIKTAICGGVNLADDERAELRLIEKELKHLSQKFVENVRDASNSFELLIKDKKETEGLSSVVLQKAAEKAMSKGHGDATEDNGPWMITLDPEIYDDVVNNSKNRNLRNQLTRASMRRASSGDHNNIPIIDQILKLRFNKAKLLGYKNYADLSMEGKMATLGEANRLMDELRNAYLEVAVEDLKKLKNFCTNFGSKEEAAELNDLDITFWRSKFFGELSNSVEEKAQKFFTWTNVRDALFDLSKNLFAIDIKQAKDVALVWDEDVEFYSVYDSKCKLIAYFSVDPYARPTEKEDGAWTVGVFDESSVRSRDGFFARLPIVHVVYNLARPMESRPPSLLTFNEVVTVFHEFGHALHRMLTKQNERVVYGVQGMEWDAVELPSLFMERWCYHKETLRSMGRHCETDELISKSLCTALLKNADLCSGITGIEQVRLGILDLQLHSEYIPDGTKTALDYIESVYKSTSLYPMLQEDRSFCTSSHIFTDEYAAGYYSYEWSKMMAVDVFSAFKDAGLNDEKAMKEMGCKFRDTIFALGCGNTAKELFKQFMGKEHSSKELLKQIRKSLPKEPQQKQRKKSSREWKRRKNS